MLILLSVFPALAAQSALEPVTIQLRWFHQFQFAGYYAAIEKGFYADEGLQVSLRPFQPDQDRIAPVLKGNAQYGVGDPGLLALRDQGKPVVVLAQIFQHSPAVLISRRESEIFSADELVGKRVMLPLDDIGSASIQAMILNEIGDLNRITVVPYAYNDEKFTKGDVDAMSGYLSNEPYKLKIKGVAVNIIDPRSYSIDFYGDNLFTTEKEVVEHPERVNKVIRATLKGWAYALKHKDDIIDLILTKYNPNLNREQLRYEAKMIDQMIVPDLVPIGEINPKRYDRIAETYHRLGMITASSVPDGFIYAGRPEPAVSLTTQERAWLKAHPDITLGYADSFEPLLIVNDDGTFSGVLFDILEALNKKLGTNIGLRINSVPKILEMAQKKEVDGVLSLHPDYAAELRLLATDGYINAYPTVFARKEANFTGPADFAGKNVAILDKVYFSEDIIQQYGGQANIVRVTNVAEGLQKVQNGSVDFFIGLSSNNYTLQKYRLGGLESKHTFFDFTDKFGYAVRSDWPALVSILNKGISSFSEQEIESLARKWMELPLQKQTVALNPEERAWLDAHPDITLGYTDAFEPEVIVNPNGNYRGILVDILAELNSRLGTRIRLRIDPIPEVLEKVQEKEIDGILSILPDYAEKLGLLKTRRYITSYPTVFARRDVSFNRPSDLAGKRVAVIDKVFFSEQIVRQHGPGATVLKVKDAKEGLQLIGNRQADFFLGATLNAYLLTQYQLLDLANQYVFFDHPINNVIGTRSDWPELSAILDKGLASFSNEEIESISAKWIQLPQPKNIIQLTAKEKAWLAQKHIVQVRVVNIPPYIILKEGGEPEGISIDYLNFIAERTGVKFEFRFSGKPFPEALDGLIEHSGPDLISSMLPTPEREKSVLFSKDYYRSPYVIFTHNKDKTFISDMTDLYGRKIALPKGTVVLEKIKKDYPDLKLVLFDNESLAIEAVATEKADAYIGNLTLASFLILEKGLSGLKIAGPSPFGDHVLSMGIRNDWPALVSIIDKALATMSQEEHAKIRNKYVAIRYDHAERAAYIKWFAIISGAALLASLLFVFWNRQLAEKVKKRTAEIRASRDYLKSLTDSMPDAVFSVSMPDRKIEWANDTISLLGYEAAECIGRTTEFLYPSRQDYLAFGEVMAHAVAAGKEVLRRDQDLKKKNGDTFPADITMSIFKVNGEVVSVTAIVRDISERKQKEQQLQKHQERLKALAYQLTVAEEKERRTIAADLHDNVGQALTIARMQVAATQKRVTDAPMSAELNEISNTLYEALQDTRQLMFDLSPPLLDELGLSAAVVEWLETQVGQRYNIETAFLDELDDHFEHLIEESARAILFRNVRELLINVVKHAQSNTVSVHLKNSNDRMKIIVEDDGIGFDPEAAIQSGPLNGGFGLFSIQERMADLGGSLEIASEPGKGCKATLTVPVGGKAWG